MRPLIALDSAIVSSNFSAWQALAGVPVRPVIKCNAYNWGYGRLIEILDPLCEEYCVADIDEVLAARAFSDHPLIVLGAIPAGRIAEALETNAIPAIDDLEQLEAACAWAQRAAGKPRIRVGLRPAVGWAGIDLSQIEELSPQLAASGFPVEVWSHVSDERDLGRLRERITQAVHTLRSHGVRVTGTEIASTYPLAASGALGDRVRVGIGLFGSTGGHAVDGVRCAIRLVAPVVSSFAVKAGTKVGYGDRKIGQDGNVLTLRCGYGDGLPKALASASDIL